jgi:hypothetical protein
MIRVDAGDDVVGTVLPQPADESWGSLSRNQQLC